MLQGLGGGARHEHFPVGVEIVDAEWVRGEFVHCHAELLTEEYGSYANVVE